MGCKMPRPTDGEGLWSLKEQKLYINVLELKAMYLAIQTFTKEGDHQHILVKTDNATAKVYINHVGRTHSQFLNSIALYIWKWCLHYHLHLTAEYLLRLENQVADEKSRQLKDCYNWMLQFTSTQMFQQIYEMMGPFDVDRF